MGATQSNVKPRLDFDNLNFYEILGISKDASNDEIKRAYRQRALENHPDKNMDDIDGATKRFAKVLDAYQTLTDPTSRTMYDYELDNKSASETQQPSRGKSMPGQGHQRGMQPPRSGLLDQLLSVWVVGLLASWLAWLLFVWLPAPLSSRYIPKSYIARNGHLWHPQGISARDIHDYIAYCAKKSTWVESEKEQSLFTLIRNLFECLAYDERRWGNTDRIPDFGCGTSAWCPDDDPHANHYAEDFYHYWLNFETNKSFDWVNPCWTGPQADSRTLRKVEQENRKIHKALREEYNNIIRTLVDSLLRSDPRFMAHIYYQSYANGQTPQNDSYSKFVKKCQARATKFQARTRTQTRSERKKENKKNKKNQKK